MRTNALRTFPMTLRKTNFNGSQPRIFSHREVHLIAMSNLWRDKKYVRGEVCLMKWNEDDGPCPANPQRCGEVAVAGYGLARDASFVHPTDPRAITDIFLCERHAQLYEKKMAAGSKFGEFIPKVGGATN
jgi:hypothetical protein